MIRRIVCLVEDSDSLQKDEVQAAEISKACGAKLILLYVTEQWKKLDMVITDSREWNDIYGRFLLEGKKLLDRKAEELKKIGVECLKIELRDGDTTSELASVVYEQAVDLLVLDRKKKKHLKKLFSPGSMEEELPEYEACNILWV